MHTPAATAQQTSADALSLLPAIGAGVSALLLFGAVLLVLRQSRAGRLWSLMYKGAFGSWFSWQNTLTRASPLLLTALCVALPARLGLVVIGGEGALVLGGGCAAAAVGVPLPGWSSSSSAMALAGMIAGGVWIGARRRAAPISRRQRDHLQPADGLYRHRADEPFRRRAAARSGEPQQAVDLSDRRRLHDRHHPWPATCIGAWWSASSPAFAWRVGAASRTWGFAAARGRAATCAPRSWSGLPVGRLVLAACALGGAFAGLAGMIEVAAVQGNANASLAAGYGYTGILVASSRATTRWPSSPVRVPARRHRRLGRPAAAAPDLPDATVLVLEGILFVAHPGPRDAACGRSSPLRVTTWPTCAQTDLRHGQPMAIACTRPVGALPLAILGGAIRVSTPFIFVCLGECITERSGRINLGLEGTLVLAAP